MRAAVYARMSTDRQSADSPADQISRCRDFAASHSWTIAEALIVEDAGISGASRHERPQFLELMARIDEWDVLLCWDFSRLARNEEASAGSATASERPKRTPMPSTQGARSTTCAPGSKA